MKNFLCTVLLIFIFCSAAAAAIQNSLHGFRGIRWGESADKFPDLELVNESFQDGNVVTRFIKRDEPLSMGEAKLEKIIYEFYNNEFVAAVIEVQGSFNEPLLKALKISFGEPEKPVANTDMYEWKDENARIIFCTFLDDIGGVVVIHSQPLFDKYVRKNK